MLLSTVTSRAKFRILVYGSGYTPTIDEYATKREEYMIEDNLCWWCSNAATHYFKYSKRYCCSDNVSRCPAVTKKVVDTRKENDSYTSGYYKGLSTKRTTVFDDGTSILSRSVEKFKNTITTDDVSGSSIAKRRAKKMLATKQATIDPITGLNLCQLAGVKSVNTKYKVDTETGLNLHQISAKRAMTTKLKIDENGNDWFNRVRDQLVENSKVAGDKMHQSRILDIDSDGLDHYARRTKKMIEDIDLDGKNAFDRADSRRRRTNARRTYKTTDLHYQCSYELKWLTELENTHGYDWLIAHVKNGPTIEYFNPVIRAVRFYFADFQIDDTVYEIKSRWTWDGKGAYPDRLAVNIAKLDATVKSGYKVVLILDNVKKENWNET